MHYLPSHFVFHLPSTSYSFISLHHVSIRLSLYTTYLCTPSNLSPIIPYTRSLCLISPSPSACLYFTPVYFITPSSHLLYPSLVYVHIHPISPYPSTRKSHSIIANFHSFIILQYPLFVPHRLDSYAYPGACNYFSSQPPPLPGCSATVEQHFQRGTIQLPAKLSQKHHQLWENQSAQNVSIVDCY